LQEKCRKTPKRPQPEAQRYPQEQAQTRRKRSQKNAERNLNRFPERMASEDDRSERKRGPAQSTTQGKARC